MNKIIIIFLIVVLLDGLMKHYNLFELFIEGVKEALTLVKSIFTIIT